MDQQADDELENQWDGILASLVQTDFSDKLNELEDILNYKFERRNLVEEALTHSSVTLTFCERLESLGFEQSQYSAYLKSKGLRSYERLEFVGDAILGQLITTSLYSNYPDLKPGILTRLRSQNVQNETLARVAVKHRFFHYLRLESSDLQDMIQKFIQEVENESEPGHGNNSKAPKILADIVESIVGAVFIDSGNSADRVWEVFEPLLQPLVDPETLEMHPVTALQELCQKQGKIIKYEDSIGDNNMFIVDACIDGQIMGSGRNKKKKLAKNAAAENAFSKFYNEM